MSFKIARNETFCLHARDKRIHFGASMLAAIAMVTLYHVFGHGQPGFGLTLLVVLVPGFVRELYNGFKPGSSGFSFADMLANYLGVSIGWIFSTALVKALMGTL